MTVLGWSDQPADAPDLYTEMVGNLAVISVPDLCGSKQREQLRLQIKLAGACRAFLPARPGTPARAALDRTRLSAGAIEHRLQHLRDRVQITISARTGLATRGQNAACGSGADWLADRAAHQRRATERAGQVTDVLRHVVEEARVETIAEASFPSQNACSLNLLVARAAVGSQIARLSQVLGRLGPRHLHGVSCSVAGPLPAFAFAGGAL